MNMSAEFTLFSGTANPDLTAAVGKTLGASLGAVTVERFPDGELTVHVFDIVRRKEVFILQSTSPPVNDHLIELF